jgi:hypothetical protein
MDAERRARSTPFAFVPRGCVMPAVACAAGLFGLRRASELQLGVDPEAPTQRCVARSLKSCV